VKKAKRRISTAMREAVAQSQERKRQWRAMWLAEERSLACTHKLIEG
jgi:hypothetical protein